MLSFQAGSLGPFNVHVPINATAKLAGAHGFDHVNAKDVQLSSALNAEAYQLSIGVRSGAVWCMVWGEET